MHAGLITPRPTMLPKNIARGATLLEVMIALMIFSIGMLGLSALQVTGLRETGNAEKRTQATLLANDMIERMRANPKGVSDGSYDDAVINYAAIDCTVPPATYCEDSGATAAAACTTAQIATFDAYTVKCQANVRLPSGTISQQCTDNVGVAVACAANTFRTVTISWVNVNEYGTASKGMTFILRP